MNTPKTKPKVTSFAPQFLVDDLARSIAYYQKLGFAFGEPWDGFYAFGELDGLELHLKEWRTDHQATHGGGVGHDWSLPAGRRDWLQDEPLARGGRPCRSRRV
ncbi:MAG: hypothetical protein JJE40_07590 [Vicinamibacteria bacterium]|nr:hypothetical protein [Vicinamibacteria bacterium]